MRRGTATAQGVRLIGDIALKGVDQVVEDSPKLAWAALKQRALAMALCGEIPQRSRQVHIFDCDSLHSPRPGSALGIGECDCAVVVVAERQSGQGQTGDLSGAEIAMELQ